MQACPWPHEASHCLTCNLCSTGTGFSPDTLKLDPTGAPPPGCFFTNKPVDGCHWLSALPSAAHTHVQPEKQHISHHTSLSCFNHRAHSPRNLRGHCFNLQALASAQTHSHSTPLERHPPAVAKLLAGAKAKEAELRATVLHWAFRAGQLDESGVPLRLTAEVIATRMDLPLPRWVLTPKVAS